jgi:hypothetical protein
MSYSIEEHKHRFAAWAAGSAASVNGCRFKVWQAKKILEDASLREVGKSVENLPHPEHFDKKHSGWRESVISTARKYSDKNGNALSLTHGVAAKLINMYLKSIFVCSNKNEDPRIKAIHPPIDSVLLNTLYKKNIGMKKTEWLVAKKVRWSNFNSTQYQRVISTIKEVLPDGAGLWQIEEHWQGYQS